MQVMKKKLEWRHYITTEVLLNTKRMELINKKKFATAALDKNAETFIVYITTLSAALAI